MNQISIFTENKKGAMRNITRILAENEVNINALVTNDSAEFGIIRMLVSSSEIACQKLRDAGYMVHINSVVCVKIGDEPGSLDKLLLAILDSNINVDYLYMSYDRESGSPIAVVKVTEAYEVAECLKCRGYGLLM